MSTRGASWVVLAALAACGSSSSRERAGDVESPPVRSDARAVASPPVATADAGTPRVTLRDVSVAGALNDDEGRVVIEHNLHRYEACYGQALAAEPTLCGWLELSLEDDRHGNGFSGSMDGPDAVVAAMAGCAPMELTAPGPALAAPGTSYRFTLVLTPPSSTVEACEPSVLDRADRACTTDADCTMAISYRRDGETCCPLCLDTPANTTWSARALEACTAIQGTDCPNKRCEVAPAAVCRAKRCTAAPP